jgi:hypothetical protein
LEPGATASNSSRTASGAITLESMQAALASLQQRSDFRHEEYVRFDQSMAPYRDAPIEVYTAAAYLNASGTIGSPIHPRDAAACIKTMLAWDGVPEDFKAQWGVTFPKVKIEARDDLRQIGFSIFDVIGFATFEPFRKPLKSGDDDVR